MKNKLKEFIQFLLRCVLAGGILLIGAGIIYGVVCGTAYLIGTTPRDDYSFWYQYIQVGFWIGFFAVVRDLKEFWK